MLATEDVARCFFFRNQLTLIAAQSKIVFIFLLLARQFMRSETFWALNNDFDDKSRGEEGRKMLQVFSGKNFPPEKK